MTVKARIFLTKSGYKFIELNLKTIGNYAPQDSEWNYSDVMHFAHVHKIFDQVILGLSNTTNCSFFIQKILFMKIPNIIYQIHETSNTHEYFGCALTTPISIITNHNKSSKNEHADTLTNYRFYYQSFFGYMIALFAKYAAKNNYKKVIDEDMPMRSQRGLLRKNKNIRFIQDDKKFIGFLETTDISKSNVLFRKDFSFIKNIDLDGNDSIINVNEIYLQLKITNNFIYILPTICPHEGAPLKNCINDKNLFSCPWHGRKINEILSIAKPLKDSTINVDFMGGLLTVATKNNSNKISINLKV